MKSVANEEDLQILSYIKEEKKKNQTSLFTINYLLKLYTSMGPGMVLKLTNTACCHWY